MSYRLMLAVVAALLVLPGAAQAQPAAEVVEPPELTVPLIMQDHRTWVGAWPEQPFWTDAGDHLYFQWNPGGDYPADSLFRVPVGGGEAERVDPGTRRNLPPRFDGFHSNRLAYDHDFGLRVFVRNGDLFVYDIDGDEVVPLIVGGDAVSGPRFAPGSDSRIVFSRGGNLFALDLAERWPRLDQLTDLRRGSESTDPGLDDQLQFLEDQQLELFDVLLERTRRDSLATAAREAEQAARDLPTPLYYGEGNLQRYDISPDERFVTVVVATSPADARPTRMTDYVTTSGYTEELTARPKVGSPVGSMRFLVQDLRADTSFTVDFSTLPGAFEPAEYQREQGIEADSARVFVPFGPYWSPDGRYAVIDVRTRDNKDRWIARLNPEEGTLTSLHHDRDDAWIAGPGISWFVGPSSVGWIPESSRFWFHSERTGHSHLYTVDAATGTLAALTSGEFEVHEAQLSRDGRTWFLLTNEASPFEMHAYRMPVEGGARERLTSMTGGHNLAVHPEEHTLGMLFSTSNRPPEIFLQEARPGAEAERITHSPTDEWLAYPWREAEIIEIPASDGAQVPARIYRPDNPNGAAVLFVHGAGYLQNVHRWWSSYFREYMFHNMLADQGYVVLDLDFRASAGYGRDWRTDVYRHMGGRDLQDYVDASRFVRAEFGIEPERVGIYGGSYGGFITLMALMTEPEHFGAGAALRAVTDWAHYNDPYTTNILNHPARDPEAYERSSPINFAEGLARPLLMTHGLVDVNVQPQDIFRYTQRLIELGKTDWELAIFPVEDHGFVEPSSWTDQYRRIYELFERHLH